MRRSSLNLTDRQTADEIPQNVPIPPTTKIHYEERDHRKRKISDEQYMESPISVPGRDETIAVRLFRSNRDPNPIPAVPHNSWYLDELRKDEFGLKLSVKDLDSSKIIDYLRRDKFKFSKPTINIIPHDTFITMDRHITTKSTIAKKPKQFTTKHTPPS